MKAQYNLALHYKDGEGIAKDLSQAVEWFRRAAEQGFSSAQHSMGLSYEFGYGIDKDINKAVEWYRKAAAQGHENAKLRLKALGRE